MTTCDPLSLPTARPRPNRGRGLAAAFVALFATLLGAQPAGAQAEDQAAARALFDEAKRLMAAGQVEQACPKLEAASKLYAGSGVLLNLGDCYEKTRRTASAWTAFGEAAATAARTGRADDELEAKRRQRAIEPRLSRMAVRVARETPGLAVTRDGRPLDRAVWGMAIPVDPGMHALSADAADRIAWSASVAVIAEGKTVTVDVPELREVAATAAPTATPATPNTPSMTANATPGSGEGQAPVPPAGGARRTFGLALGGAGIVAVGAGVGLGLGAKSQYRTAEGEAGVARHDDSVSAVNRGNVATIVFGLGAAAAVAGAVVWLTAPSAPAAVGTNGRALFVAGRF